jgi:tRNA (guanine-N7-)-methyltransferase
LDNAPSSLPQRRAGNQTFGRRLGRPLSAARRAALKHLDQLAIDQTLFAQPGTLNPRALFPRAVDQVWFEIGFGAGEHLRARLEKSPR